MSSWCSSHKPVAHSIPMHKDSSLKWEWIYKKASLLIIGIRGVEHIYNLHTLNSPHNDREWHCLRSSPLLEPCWSHILKWEWQFVFYQHLKRDGHTFPPPPSHRHWINDGVATEKTRTSLDGLLHKLGHWLDVKRIKHLTGTGRQRENKRDRDGCGCVVVMGLVQQAAQSTLAWSEPSSSSPVNYILLSSTAPPTCSHLMLVSSSWFELKSRRKAKCFGASNSCTFNRKLNRKQTSSFPEGPVLTPEQFYPSGSEQGTGCSQPHTEFYYHWKHPMKEEKIKIVVSLFSSF